MIPFQLHRRIPLVRRPFYQRDQAVLQRDHVSAERDALIRERDTLAVERDALRLERDALRLERDGLIRQQNLLILEHDALAQQRVALAAECEQYAIYVGVLGFTLQYRQAHFEIRSKVAPGVGLPTARSWPSPDNDISYEQKLIGTLEISTGRGVELGPLNIPIVSKSASNVLYVDHLDTEGLRAKYSGLSGIVDIDRPVVNDSLADTLQNDAPLDYFVGSQVFEHVANPIRWLQEIATILREGGLLSLSLPDRRLTFDMLREETRAADIVSAYLAGVDTPDVRSVYDHHSLASFVNMHWANPASVYPDDVTGARGAIKPQLATDAHLAFVERAKNGEYLDVHAWVFTPPSFLLVMAQLAGDGSLPYRLRQFYPTNSRSSDRGSSSFVVVLERVEGVPAVDLRRTYLEALGE